MYQQTTFIGHLGFNPKYNQTTAGNSVANVNVCSTHRYTIKKTKEVVEEACWLPCVFFGDSADNVMDILKKGMLVMVVGRLRDNPWQDEHGQKRTTKELIVSRWLCLTPKPRQGPEPGAGAPEGGGAAANGTSTDDAPEDPADYTPPGPNDDDISF